MDHLIEMVVVGLFIIAGFGVGLVVLMFLFDLLLAIAQYVGIVRRSDEVTIKEPPFLLSEDDR